MSPAAEGIRPWVSFCVCEIETGGWSRKMATSVCCVKIVCRGMSDRWCVLCVQHCCSRANQCYFVFGTFSRFQKLFHLFFLHFSCFRSFSAFFWALNLLYYFQIAAGNFSCPSSWVVSLFVGRMTRRLHLRMNRGCHGCTHLIVGAGAYNVLLMSCNRWLQGSVCWSSTFFNCCSQSKVCL